MFGVCSSLGIANVNNRKVLFSSDLQDIKNVFPLLNINVVQGTMWKGWKSVVEEYTGVFDPKFMKLPMENVSISKFLQSYHYFSRIDSELLFNLSYINQTVLGPVKHFMDTVVNISLMKINEKSVTSVCMHVRRGDVVSSYQRNRGYQQVPADALHFAMNYMKNVSKNIIFIVVSNDKKWCKEHLSQDNVYFSNFSSPWYDFILLQQCNHMIMTLGTYGWWGAWFTKQKGGTVMYYRHPFRKGSIYDKKFNKKHFYPSNWLNYDANSVS